MNEDDDDGDDDAINSLMSRIKIRVPTRYGCDYALVEALKKVLEC